MATLSFILSLCLFAFIFILPGTARGEVIRGVFGVPAVERLQRAVSGKSAAGTTMAAAGVNAVFVPEDGETIRWFKKQGYKVYLSINAFGGRGAWEGYPDARPVKADGSPLGTAAGDARHGGVCPTHQAWRASRLSHLEKLVLKYGDSIDGIWLDFVRYPGFWETEEPEVPDTCYCLRCLRKFQEERKIVMPAGLNTREASAWIKKRYPYQWMTWKKGQITSFIAEAKDILARHGKGKIILGIFVVPWTKGERGNAISYKLGQDAFQLSEMVDVLSPMVYHRMCGKPVSWVAKMTRYYKETVPCQVWPIVQAAGCKPEEFKKVLRAAGEGGADGILVFSYGEMQPSLWKELKAFQPLTNLIANPELIPSSRGHGLPSGWLTEERGGDPAVKGDFSVTEKQGIRCLGITGGYDRKGNWYSELPRGEVGEEYIFTGLLYRETWENGVYPSLSIWGQEFYLNNHWMVRQFQPIMVYVTFPENCQDFSFRFMNYNPKKTFLLGRPKLVENGIFSSPPLKRKIPPHPPLEKGGWGDFQGKEVASFYPDFFPIGAYGATRDNLREIKKLAINTVIIGGEGEELRKTIEECHRVGLRYVLSVPRDPDSLTVYLDSIAGKVRPSDVAFYLNDEPELVSFPINKAGDIYRLVKGRFPASPTCMALVRPQRCRDYLEASDFFMMDQYPIPSRPLVWLSDSMDEAAGNVGADRLVSVIQAFGGEQYAAPGWPRLPTWEEMNCLAFLSVVHGGRGVFFFSFSEIGRTEEGRKNLGLVVGRLNQIYPWLLTRNVKQKVQVEMTSTYRLDPVERPAVQCCLKERGKERLLLAVNTLGTYVEARMKVETAGETPREVFSGGDMHPLVNGAICATFKPYEVKAFLLKSR